MNRLDTLPFDSFANHLLSAHSRLQGRMTRLENLIHPSGRVNLFGFGGKGRALAWQIRELSNLAVTVFDSSAETRDRAAREGFAVVDRLEDLPQDSTCTILGACQ